MPEGWCWTTIEEISKSIFYGISESAKSSGNYKLLRITDIQEGQVDWSKVPFTDFDVKKADQYLLSPGDILFARTGATVGKSYLAVTVPNNAIYASYLIRIRYSNLMCPQYVKFFFESGYYWEQISNSSVGVGQPNVNGTLLGKLRIPIPPAAEQLRIAEEALKLINIIDKVDSNAEAINKNIMAAKSIILNLAIHGKLVPQEPSDEPAIAFLKRINPIFTPSDNLHYEGIVPKGWQLCQLSDIFDVTMGQSPEGNSLNTMSGIEFHQGKICFTEKYLSKSEVLTSSPTKYAISNSLLCCVRAPVGVFNITLRKICIGRGLCALTPRSDSVELDYWFYALSSYRDYYEDKATGTTFKAISGEVIRNTMVLLPPELEQRRILKRITELFSILDQISNPIDSTEQVLNS